VPTQPDVLCSPSSSSTVATTRMNRLVRPTSQAMAFAAKDCRGTIPSRGTTHTLLPPKDGEALLQADRHLRKQSNLYII
jgi:hypothetical protein